MCRHEAFDIAQWHHTVKPTLDYQHETEKFMDRRHSSWKYVIGSREMKWKLTQAISRLCLKTIGQYINLMTSLKAFSVNIIHAPKIRIDSGLVSGGNLARGGQQKKELTEVANTFESWQP